MQITNKDRPVPHLESDNYPPPAAKAEQGQGQVKDLRVAPTAVDGQVVASPGGAVTSTGQTLDPATSDLTALFRQQFADAAADPQAFHAMMKQVYGQGYDAGKAEQFRQQALKGDFSFLPDIQFVPGEDLQYGNAAYNAAEGVIYVNQDFANNPKGVASAVLEEIGHHLDTQLNKSDTVGDEGELFRRILSGEKLSAADITAIRAENDQRTIRVDGKEVQVEFNFFADVGKAFSNVGKAIVKAVTHVGESIVSLPKRIGDAIKVEPSGNVLTDIWNGIKAPFKAVGEVIKTAVSVPVAVLTIPLSIAGESLKLVGKVIDPLIPQGVKDWLGEAGKKVGNALGEVAEVLAPVLAPIFAVYDFVMAPFRDILGPITEPFGDAITELTGHLPQPLKGVGHFVGDIVGDPATWVEVLLTAGIATGVRATIAKGLGKTVMRETGEAAAKAAAKKAIAKSATQRAVSKGAQEAAEKAAMEAAEQLARKGAKASLKKTGMGWKAATREANKKAAVAAAGRELGEETAQKVMQEAAEKALKEAAEQGSKKAILHAGTIADDTIRGMTKELKAARRASDAAQVAVKNAERKASKDAAKRHAGDFTDAAKQATKQADDAAKAAKRQGGEFGDVAKQATKQADDAAKAAKRQGGEFGDVAKQATKQADDAAAKAAKRQGGEFGDVAKQATKQADDAAAKVAKRQGGEFGDVAKQATKQADDAAKAGERHVKFREPSPGKLDDLKDAQKAARDQGATSTAAWKEAQAARHAKKAAAKQADDVAAKAAKRNAGNFADEAADAVRQADELADDVSVELKRLQRDPVTGQIIDPNEVAKGTQRHVKFRDPSPQKLAELDEAKKLAREKGATNTTAASEASKARHAERHARKEAARHADDAKAANKRNAGEWSKESGEVNSTLRKEKGMAGDYTDEMKKLLEEEAAFPSAKEIAEHGLKHGAIHHGADAALELGKERAKEELQEEGEEGKH